MKRLQEYVDVGARRLRCGYTTGTCAAAAARAGAELLWTGTAPSVVVVHTPAGVEVQAEVECTECGEGWAAAAVRKDAGDDPDVTDGVLVWARVQACVGPAGTVEIDGGEGVGRVTLPGLEQPVGAAAINRVPRDMIAGQVREAAAASGWCGACRVTVSIPSGQAVAARTFNPRLGIEGGLSVLGTGGIVRPMSEEALVESLKLEIAVARAQGARQLVLAPGNYGADFARTVPALAAWPLVQCSNYVGAALDAARLQGFEDVLVVGHLGKMAKVAAGAMNTHSRVCDGRLEALAAHAAAAGAPGACVRAVLACATTDAALDELDAAGVLPAVAQALAQAVEGHLARRAGGSLRVGALVFSNVRGELFRTQAAEAWLGAADADASADAAAAGAAAEAGADAAAAGADAEAGADAAAAGADAKPPRHPVLFVGAGPGAPDLLTLRGADALAQADVVVHAGSLVNPALLGRCKPGAQALDSAGMTLEEVVEALAAAHQAGRRAVRLHTGDPSLYGAVAEQMRALDARDVPYAVVPGVSSMAGAAAALGVEYTVPGGSQTVVVSRVAGRTPVPDRERLRRLAAHGATLVLFLSAGHAQQVQDELLAAGMAPATPAAVVYKATWPDERTVRCTAGTLAACMRREGIANHALIVVGECLANAPARSLLYDPAFSHGFRTAEGAAAEAQAQAQAQAHVPQQPAGSAPAHEPLPSPVALVGFTREGCNLAGRLARALEGAGCPSAAWGPARMADACGVRAFASLFAWTAEQFSCAGALVFVGAAGIAVRAVAPLVEDKFADPAVVCVDEAARFCTPLLSGHVGGANALARAVARASGAQAAVGTATDVRGVFAVDDWARTQGLAVLDRAAARDVAAALLEGEPVGFSADMPCAGALPAGLVEAGAEPAPRLGIHVSPFAGQSPWARTLRLAPRTVCVGVGCRRGVAPEALAAQVDAALARAHVLPAAVACLATVDLKADEPALTALAHQRGWPLRLFTAEELRAQKGAFASSAFVQQTVGVDNVCERAAVAAAQGGALVAAKHAAHGVTVALAAAPVALAFPETERR